MDRIRSLCSLVALAVGIAGAAQAQEKQSAPRIAGPEELGLIWRATSPQMLVVYPEELAAKGTTGCVTLAFLIERDGTTSDFRTLDAAASSRSPLAKQQAIEAFARSAAASVANWRFTPVGEPIRTFTATTVDFDRERVAAGQTCRTGNIARALGRGRPWKDILRDVYEARFRYYTGENDRPQPEPSDRYIKH